MEKIIKTLCMCSLGIAFLIIGIYTYVNNIDEVKDDAITIEATITRIEDHSIRNEMDYSIYVSYNFDNVEYKDKRINLNSNLYKIGDKIKVKINMDSPDIPVYLEQSKIAIVIIIAGIIMILFGIYISIYIF